LTNSREDSEFINLNALKIPAIDLEVIRRDWEIIQSKCLANKAHELSEGDTNYLAACRKGSGGENESLKKQSGSDIRAQSRAFAFKQSYLTTIMQSHSRDENYLEVSKEITFEDAIYSMFKPFIGMNENEISHHLNYSSNAKHRKYLYTQRILSKSGKLIQEVEKSGVCIKTVSLTKNGSARESMSFPAFKAKDLINQNWDESDFADQVESRFLFVIFEKIENGEDRLTKVIFWNMPYQDRLEAKQVWEKTKSLIEVNPHNLPKPKDNPVAHVRPHGKNKNDLDEAPNGEWIPKQCFWLKGSYIAEQIKLSK
jgi:DNA mismatch repair protein MutH